MKTQLLKLMVLFFTTTAFLQNIGFNEIVGIPFEGLRRLSFAFTDVEAIKTRIF